MGIDKKWIICRDSLITRLASYRGMLSELPKIDDVDLRARKEEPIRDVIYETKRYLRGLYIVFPELRLGNNSLV